MSDKPVLYLDVDDTILMFPPNRDRLQRRVEELEAGLRSVLQLSESEFPHDEQRERIAELVLELTSETPHAK